MKRILAAILALLMLCTLLPVSALAAGNNSPGAGDDWSQLYFDYIMNTLGTDERVDSYFDKRDWEDVTYRLVYLDEDSIPELWIDYGIYYLGCDLLTVYNDRLCVKAMGGSTSIEYIEKGNIFNSSWAHQWAFSDTIYQLKNGELVQLASGAYDAYTEDGRIDDKNMSYTWEGKAVSEAMYEQKIAEYVDPQNAKSIYDDDVAVYSYNEILDYLKNYEPESKLFDDVSSNDWYYNAVLWAVENGVTSGTSPTTFSPNQGCTRAQVVTFLWAANGKPEPVMTDNPFADVKASDWYYKPVLWAVENGITGGVSANQFGPDQTCTRAQIVTFLYAAEGKPDVNGKSTFKDVSDDAWFAAPVIWAAQNDVTGGIGEGKFGPNNTCTRGQVVTFLYKVYGDSNITPDIGDDDPKDYGASLHFSDSLKLAVDGTETLKISVDLGTYTGKYVLRCFSDDTQVAATEWGEIKNNTADLFVSGISVGATEIVVYLETADGRVLASKAFSVVVGNTVKLPTQVNYYDNGCARQENLIYNDDGLLTKYSSDYYSSIGRKYFEYNFTYNERGQLVEYKEVKENNPSKRYYYSADGVVTGWSIWDMDLYEKKTTYVYDENGRIIKESISNGAGEKLYFYDEQGLLLRTTKEERYGDMHILAETIYAYDQNGRLAEAVLTSDIGMGQPTTETVKYSYEYAPFVLVETYFGDELAHIDLRYGVESILELTYHSEAEIEMTDGYVTKVTTEDCTYEIFYDGEIDPSFTERIPY